MRSGSILGLVLVAWLATGVFFVGTDEQGVIRRCGRILPQVVEPGAHFGFPWPFDQIDRVKPNEVKRLAITVAGGGETAAGAGPQFLTGDRNLVAMRATVQYTIADPVRYLTAACGIEDIIRATAESNLANLLAETPVDRVLTLGKRELGVVAADQLQSALREFDLGILVRSVDIGAVEPPPQVADSFERVTSALREREQVMNQAQGFSDRTVALAQATAEQGINQAKAHRDKVLQDAQGEAERFSKLREQYEAAPTLTAHRLYFETLAEILPRFRSKLVVGTKLPIDLGIMREEKK